MIQRLEKLRQKLIDVELDVILITQPENRHYLSGFDGSAGTLLISPNRAILATDFRYIEQVKRQAPYFEISQTGTVDRERHLVKLVSEMGVERLGFEADDLSYSDYNRLKEEADKLKVQIIPTHGLVESLRIVKDQEEIASIMKAAELSDSAVEYITDIIHPGMTEKEIAWELERFLREKGSAPLPFEIIVASGPNAALPHAQPSDRPVSNSEPIIMDLGASVSGYASDITRTLCLGSPDKTFTKIYDLVLKAQFTAIERMEAGMSGEQVDEFARKIIEQGGYKEAFGHGLGHGVGLAIHESPRLGPNSNDPLEENMVFTIEPGIYISGWGGVRIEDLVMIENGRVKLLSKARK